MFSITSFFTSRPSPLNAHFHWVCAHSHCAPYKSRHPHPLVPFTMYSTKDQNKRPSLVKKFKPSGIFKGKHISSSSPRPLGAFVIAPWVHTPRSPLRIGLGQNFATIERVGHGWVRTYHFKTRTIKVFLSLWDKHAVMSLTRIAVYLDGRFSSRGHILTFHPERSPSPSHLSVLYSFLIFPFIHQYTPIPLNFPSSFAMRIHHCTFHT